MQRVAIYLNIGSNLVRESPYLGDPDEHYMNKHAVLELNVFLRELVLLLLLLLLVLARHGVDDGGGGGGGGGDGDDDGDSDGDGDGLCRCNGE